MRGLNALMFRALDAVVIIARDTEKLLLRYRGMTREKIRFIPNWATLARGVRAVDPDNPYRRPLYARFVVGLSGNLGFTHDPVIVFEAVRLLRDDEDIHFLLSGWGVGFDQLKAMQAEAKLSNVTLVDRVEDDQLETFLSSADVWIIPYRRNVAGVSVPSRFYNLLAIGRPVILVSEPDAEAALTVIEHDVGWVVEPGNADALAKTVSRAAGARDPQRPERAAEIAGAIRFQRGDGRLLRPDWRALAKEAGLADRWFPAREAVHQKRGGDATDDEKQDGDDRRRGHGRTDRQRGKQDVECKYFAHHTRY